MGILSGPTRLSGTGRLRVCGGRFFVEIRASDHAVGSPSAHHPQHPCMYAPCQESDEQKDLHVHVLITSTSLQHTKYGVPVNVYVEGFYNFIHIRARILCNSTFFWPKCSVIITKYDTLHLTFKNMLYISVQNLQFTLNEKFLWTSIGLWTFTVLYIGGKWKLRFFHKKKVS